MAPSRNNAPDAPAAPVGDDAELIVGVRLIASSLFDRPNADAMLQLAADRLKSQAARIAELERERDQPVILSEWQQMERQLAAAQACIVAADAMRARTARVPEHWAAYDAARAALGAGDGAPPPAPVRRV